MKEHNCNCLAHYNQGFDYAIDRQRAKYRNPDVVFTYPELEKMLPSKPRFDGAYAFVVFHDPKLEPAKGYKAWQIVLNQLTETLGVRVTKIVFEPNVEVETYSFGLVEE